MQFKFKFNDGPVLFGLKKDCIHLNMGLKHIKQRREKLIIWDGQIFANSWSVRAI